MIIMLISVGAPILLLLALTLLVRTFPGVLGEALVKRIQFGYDSKLEETKAFHQERLETGTSSVNYLSSMQAELRVKTIESAESLWRAMISIKKDYSDIVYLLTILYPDEINASLQMEERGPLARVENYSDFQFATDKFERFTTVSIEETRLFVGDRLWHLFFAFRVFHGRLGYLMHNSFEESEYFDWRKDDHILSQLRPVLDDVAIEDAIQDPFGGVQVMVSYLESEFQREATRVMSGSQALADSLSDIQSTFAYGAQMKKEIQKNRMYAELDEVRNRNRSRVRNNSR